VATSGGSEWNTSKRWIKALVEITTGVNKGFEIQELIRSIVILLTLPGRRASGECEHDILRCDDSIRSSVPKGSSELGVECNKETGAVGEEKDGYLEGGNHWLAN
jgi:hypothetical protein